MQEVIYKQKDGNFINSTDDKIPLHFTGYKVTNDFDRISNIMEYVSGRPIGTIHFRPTKTPVIFSVSYNGYHEDRYNNGRISTIYFTNHECRFYGEYRKFNINGDVQEVRYYQDSNDVTEDVKLFVEYKGDSSEFKNYQFAEDELFNLYMFYGNQFKFYNEYKYEPNYFDEIAKFCLK